MHRIPKLATGFITKHGGEMGHAVGVGVKATDGTLYRVRVDGAYCRIDEEARREREMKAAGLSGRQRKRRLKELRRALRRTESP